MIGKPGLKVSHFCSGFDLARCPQREPFTICRPRVPLHFLERRFEAKELPAKRKNSAA